MTSSAESGPRAREKPRVVMLDRDPRRALAVSRALGERNVVCSAHFSSQGFWMAVSSVRPTVLALELAPPHPSALRTVALATGMLGRAPGVVLYGWVPERTQQYLLAELPGALLLAEVTGTQQLVDAIVGAHDLRETAPDDRARERRSK